MDGGKNVSEKDLAANVQYVQVNMIYRGDIALTAVHGWTGRIATMRKLIELDAALEGLENLNAISFYEANEHSKEAYMETKGMLKTLPTVDAVPVRLGRWIKKRYWSEGVGMGERYGYYYSCSKCGNLVCGGYDECGKKYCDECGARMDGKDGDHNDTV